MALLPYFIYTMSLCLLFFSILHYFFPHLSISSRSVFCSASLLIHIHFFCCLQMPISISLFLLVYPFLFSVKCPPSVLYHVNPSVSFGPSPNPQSLILWFICLSLAHLCSVYPACFYLYQSAGTHTGEYDSLLASISLDVTHYLISSYMSLLFWSYSSWHAVLIVLRLFFASLYP